MDKRSLYNQYFGLIAPAIFLISLLSWQYALAQTSGGVPNPPSSVTATLNTGYINVSWPAVTEATHYSIDRSLNGGAYAYVTSGFVTAYYSDYSVTSGTSYRYRVYACKSGYGCSTTATESASVTYGDASAGGGGGGGGSSPPPTPSNLTGLPSRTAGDGTDPSVATYSVYLYMDPDGNQEKAVFDWGDGSTSETGYITPANQGSWAATQHGWAVSGTYYVKAKAVDSTGLSSLWSSSFTVTVSGCGGAPPAPSTPTSNSSSGMTGTSYTFTTVLSTNPTGCTMKVAFDWGDGSSMSESASGLTGGASVSLAHAWSTTGTYSVKARTVDSAGQISAWSSPVSMAVGSGGTAPSAPSGLFSSFTYTSSIGLYWTDNSSDESDFRIERQLNGGTWSEVGTTGSNVTTFTDSSISGAGTYTYRVKACNSASCSGWSASYTPATIYSAAPTIPSGLAVTAGASSISVSWTDNSTTEWGFRLFRRVQGSSSWSGIASVFNNNSATGQVNYTDSYQLTANTVYEYVVHSYNNYESGDSNIPSACFGTCGGSGGTSSATTAYGSALNLSGVTGIFGKIWGPGSNGIVVGGGLNFSTQPGIGWAQQYGGMYVTSYSIQGVGTYYLTQTNSVGATVTGPTGSIIEVWDLETLNVIAANVSNPGSPVAFTAQPNHRYGGFAWYSDNSQKNIAIYAVYSSGGVSAVPNPPSSVAAASNTGYVYVSWPAVSDATHYSIDRSLNGGAYSYLTSGSASIYYSDYSVTSGATYRYKVYACKSGYGCSTVGTESNSITYSSGVSTTSTTSSSWVSRIWTFLNGVTQSSYILNRTDSEYTNYISSVDTLCRTVNWNNTWKPNAGDSTSTNWQNFGIPNCTASTTSSTTSSSTTSSGALGSSSTNTTTTSSSSSTDTTPPSVTQLGYIAYSDGRMRVGTSFSEPVDGATLTGDNIYVIVSETGQRLSGSVSAYSSGSDFITAYPVSVLTDYQIVVKSVRDLAGNQMPTEYRSARFRPTIASTLDSGGSNATTSPYTGLLSSGQSTTASSTASTNNKWVNHTWTFRDRFSQTSYIMNRTDGEYQNYISSVEAQCQAINYSQFVWKPLAGDDSPTNWRNFGIPDCQAAPQQGSVVITVTDSGGSLVSGATITIWSSSGADNQANYTGVTSSFGVFTVSLSPGEYDVRALAPATRSDLIYATQTAHFSVSAGDRKVVNLTFGKGDKVILGRVAYSDDTSVSNVSVGAYQSGTGAWVSTATDQNGMYSFKVSGGSWRVGIAPSSSSSAWLGGHLSTDVEFARDGSSETRQVNFSVPAAESTLLVKVADENGKALSGAGVVVDETPASESATRGNRYSVTLPSDVSGRAIFSVRSSRYYVRGYLADQNYLAPEEQTATVMPGKSIEVTLVFKKRATAKNEVVTISGRTILGDSSPVSGAFLWGWSEQGESVNEVSEDDGTYSLSVRSGNRWHLGGGAMIDGYPYKSSEVILDTGSNNISQDIALTKWKDKQIGKKAEVRQDSSKQAVVQTEDGARVTLPPNAATAPGGGITVNVTPTAETPSQAGTQVVGTAYDVTVTDSSGKEIKSLNKEVEVILPYDPVELKKEGVSEDTLKPSYYDEKAGTWITLDKYTIDKEKKIIVAKVSHLTRFAIVSAADVTPPTSPSSVAAVVLSNGTIGLSWVNPQNDFDHAKVYRSTKNKELGEVVAAEVNGTQFSDDATDKNTRYYYTVRAVDPAGNESVNTEQVAVLGAGRGGEKPKAAKPVIKANVLPTAKAAEQAGTKASVLSLSSAGGSLSRNLKLGSRGDDVALLQNLLVKEGLLDAKPTGYFGALTAAAVSKFQEKYADEVLKPAGLSKGNGFAGAKTRQKLNQLYQTNH